MNMLLSINGLKDLDVTVSRGISLQLTRSHTP
jgi:hypothetical protein